jgi:2-polyprenyl-6-hydroxyphenyl methylase/3-demethylubiquinone-9 3-methyltransferase
LRDESGQFVQYDFGSNWWSFVEGHLTDDRIEEAKKSLTSFLGVEDLRGRSFLDIGCGSGLFSLAAFLLGADRVTSIDINPNSVRCCEVLRERAGNPDTWEVRQGSVLDKQFVASLPESDIVYSWGVLHHTGSMWEAIRNAASKVSPGGMFYIAIYNSADGLGVYSDGRVGTSRFWEIEKRWYVGLPGWGKTCVDWCAAAGMILVALLRFRNPVRMIREHKTLRGMSWMVDIRDWLGGYPYEHATVEEIFRFGRMELGFDLINLHSTNSLMNNEFLFIRPAAGEFPSSTLPPRET